MTDGEEERGDPRHAGWMEQGKTLRPELQANVDKPRKQHRNFPVIWQKKE